MVERDGLAQPGAFAQEAGPRPIVPAWTSITHLHLLTIVRTEMSRLPLDRPLRVLDAGCGHGVMMAYFAQSLAALEPERRFELYGFDVVDHGVQATGFLGQALEFLGKQVPAVDWSERLAAITMADAWPYPDDFFDSIVSNQVLEHVRDPDRFFSEMRRTLRAGGFSAHLFPLRHYLFEGHLHLPLIHRILDHDLRRSTIVWLSRLGLGKFRAHHREMGVSVEDFAERHADYMAFFTNYLSHDDVLRLALRHGLRPSFRYTREFYFAKLRSLVGLLSRERYSHGRWAMLDWLSIFFMRYVSGITLFLEKKETYTTLPQSRDRDMDAH